MRSIALRFSFSFPFRSSSVAALIIAVSLASFGLGQQKKEPNIKESGEVRREAIKLQNDQNWKDALQLRQELLLDAGQSGEATVGDMQAAYTCLQNLNEMSELDGLLAKVLKAHPNDPRVYAHAAKLIGQATHYGMVIDQVFVRQPRDQRGTRWINTSEQDRHQAILWYHQALVLAGAIPTDAGIAAPANDKLKMEPSDIAQVWQELIQALLLARTDMSGWLLHAATPLDKTPDYLEEGASAGTPARRAAVDEAGNPVYWKTPADWKSASSDGQRILWCLKQLAELDSPQVLHQAQLVWADFLNSQFSVDTLQEQLWLFRPRDNGDQKSKDIKDEQSGILAIHTLKDNETIAKLASGIKRFELPDDMNPIRLYQPIASSNSLYASEALERLVMIHLNRRQYPRAAELLEESIRRFGNGRNRNGNNRYGYATSDQELLDHIRKPRAAFDPIEAQPAGQGAELSLLFRNARTAAFTARRVDLEKLLTDTKDFYRTGDRRNGFGGQRGQQPPPLEDPSYFFTDRDLNRYVSQPVANWSMDLEPRENHWDRRITVTTPLTKAGLYVIDLALDDGAHKSRCLLWINDLAIVRKTAVGGELVYVVDAVTGKAVANTTLEFVGVGYENNGRMSLENFAKGTDAQGTYLFTLPQNSQHRHWTIIARDPQGKFAVSGARTIWTAAIDPQSFMQVKAYGVADQPVHRPGDKIKARFWLGRASYGPVGETSPLANASYGVDMIDPQGKQVWSGSGTTDATGGFDIEVPLEQTAMLGTYFFQIREGANPIESNLRVRVEEFRKPEFEVKVEAPKEPVKLGEKVKAQISARYYFGSPVTEAFVNVKVTRTAFDDHWYPIRPFDWCYGPGYWWFGYDYDWYPGWARWAGCVRPLPPWFPNWNFEPPELILEQELKLSADGTAEVEIDTATAAAVFGDKDHRYSIDVEVRDASRRTLTASGSVIASREPFKIYTWLNRGYYAVNQTIDANFLAQTLDRRPIEGTGRVELLRITYNADREPEETVVEGWDAKTNSQGSFTQRLVARRGGQYRLRLRLKDSAGHEVEGAYVFTVRGDNQAADNFRFSELELIPDKAEYQPGEQVQLQINADRADATVLLFIRPSNGIVPQPKFVQLKNKTATVPIAVEANDQPNFFVEALTVYNGKFYSSTREIIVPPAKRVLDVAVKASKEEYLPGEKAALDIVVKDAQGKPVSGPVLVAVYDRALEQIASDVLPGDIREYFWKWRRSHNPNALENLNRMTGSIAIKGQPVLLPLGIFGQTIADDELASTSGKNRMVRGRGLGRTDMMFSAEASPALRSAPMGGFGGGGGGGFEKMATDEAAAPMAGAPMAMAAAAPEEAANAPAAVRKEFADSALWLTKLQCDAEGKAHAEWSMPENLTDWKMSTWAVGPGLSVGSSSTSAVTHKHILVRLIAPRFLVERDEATLSAIVHNDFDSAQNVRVRLEVDGETQLELLSDSAREQSVQIAAHEQKRVDWRVKAKAEGEITLRAFAESASESDAMQIKLPIAINGIMKTDSWAGTITKDQQNKSIEIDIPTARRVEHSQLTVRLSPSLAMAMVDALPYLVEYPYGCTEQTLNRFLPTVITQRFLNDMNVDLAKVKEHRNNLNAQELGTPAERNRQWKHFERNPVFDADEVQKMIDLGVTKLTDMQNPDGGWGWFSGEREISGAHTTATVVRGLMIARDNGAAIVPDVIERGLNWLQEYQNRQIKELTEKVDGRLRKDHPDNVDALVFHTLVLADRPNEAMQSQLYEKREHLSVYGKSLVAWATHKLGSVEQTNMLRQNIEQFLVEDAENETAYLKDASPWWYWYGSEIEATAMYLKLLAAQDPEGRVAPRLVKYLLNNRKHATYWNSTRDTALVVEAFADYLRASGEGSDNVQGEVWLDGKRLGSVAFTPETLFTAETTVKIAGNAVPAGKQKLEIKRSGNGPLYYSVYATNFTLEEEIQPAGLEVKITRRYYLLDSTKRDITMAGSRGQIIEGSRSAIDRKAIEDLQDLPSGSLVEVELLVESKNDYEYLMIEERKAAGLEPVDMQSGYDWNSGVPTYREMREKHVSFFIQHLPRGKLSLSYRLRTEGPGTYTALPAVISGMYAPELIGNSADKDLRIVEAR